jgi:hypothetical protein
VLVGIVKVVLFLLWFGFLVLTALPALLLPMCYYGVCVWGCVVARKCTSARVTVVAVLFWCDSAAALN